MNKRTSKRADTVAPVLALDVLKNLFIIMGPLALNSIGAFYLRLKVRFYFVYVLF
jgi:hypothetical protein